MISNIFIGFYDAINIGGYIETWAEYCEGFTVIEWILAIVATLIVIAALAGIVTVVVLLVRRSIKVKKNESNSAALLDEIGELNAQVIKLSKEKDRLIAQTLGIDGSYLDEPAGSAEGEEGEDKNSSKALKEGESRFFKLTQVDEIYKDYVREDESFNNEISLSEICEQFRNFACSRMGLYYDIRIIRLFLAALSSTRLIVLQGISGTGKTSLPYAWGKFLQNDAHIASVQPSWRDRTELFGYFNEFTKRFNETETLRAMYEATYTDKVYLTILDEMNIARVEYYFAEMLSILEMPSREEWVVDLTPSGWDNDPKHINNGRFRLPENMWYIGTANNDDSTYAISDKVYDRAIPININTKGQKFDAPDTGNLHISFRHIEEMFVAAKEEHKVSQENLDKLEMLDNYVIAHFRLAFGNRIVKQLRDFVPAFVACGGTEIDGLDYVLCNKILRKFEQLNLAFIRDEIDGLVGYLSELFGEENMQESKEFLYRLKKLV